MCSEATPISLSEFTLRDQILIEAPPERVWEVLTAFHRGRRWLGSARIRPLTPPPFGAGSRFHERSTAGPFWANFRLECTAWEPGRVFAWRARSFGVWGEHRWELRPQDGSTLVLDSERFWGPLPLVLLARPIFVLFRVQRIRRRLLESLRRATLEVRPWAV